MTVSNAQIATETPEEKEALDRVNTVAALPIDTLKDGKAYQFECEGDEFHGIYDKNEGSFRSKYIDIHQDFAENIQPLAVVN